MLWDSFDMGYQAPREKWSIISYTGCYYITKEGEILIEKKKISEGDFVTSTRGTKYYAGDEYEYFFINLDMERIDIKQDNLEEYIPKILIHSVKDFLKPNEVKLVLNGKNSLTFFKTKFEDFATTEDFTITLEYSDQFYELKKRYENALIKQFKKRLNKCKTLSDLLRK
jgi:hypothetical protein